MERMKPNPQQATRTPKNNSAVKTVISWLVETDREFRVTQSMVNDAQNRF